MPHPHTSPNLSQQLFFFFKHTAPPELYTLSLHDALPISVGRSTICDEPARGPAERSRGRHRLGRRHHRSEEHTSELQSRVDIVCRLLLEKKKKKRVRLSVQKQIIQIDNMDT